METASSPNRGRSDISDGFNSRDSSPLIEHPEESPERERSSSSYFQDAAAEIPPIHTPPLLEGTLQGSDSSRLILTLRDKLEVLSSLQVPNSSWLATSVLNGTDTLRAANAVESAAKQMERWIGWAAHALHHIDAENDIMQAAKAGRGSVDEVETAVKGFEGVMDVYVSAIETLQARDDAKNIPSAQILRLVNQMDQIMEDWTGVVKQLKYVKEQVEIAMEWEELCDTVIGQLKQELKDLDTLHFTLEERRRRPQHEDDTQTEDGMSTIAEETQSEISAFNHRFSLPPNFASPQKPAAPAIPENDKSLLELYARMTPLRASLDFLPMRLTAFYEKADAIFTRACDDLKEEHEKLENAWSKLAKKAETLRVQLSEDRWLSVFKSATRHIIPMMESVEKGATRLSEALEAGPHTMNPTIFAQRVENYEERKMHYMPAIEQVLGMIRQGKKERTTPSGALIMLDLKIHGRWEAVKAQLNEVDTMLREHNDEGSKLRDSISTVISAGRSPDLSVLDTPGSSPASSVAGLPLGRKMSGPNTPTNNSFTPVATTSQTTSGGKRHLSMPPGSLSASHIPRRAPTPVSGGSTPNSLRIGTPSPVSGKSSLKTQLLTHRPGMIAPDGRPRWNSSTNTSGTTIGHNFKPLTLTTPSPYRKDPSPRSTSSNRSSNALQSRTRTPVARDRSFSPSTNGSASSPGLPPIVEKPSSPATRTYRTSRLTSPSPARSSLELPTVTTNSTLPQRPRLRAQASTSKLADRAGLRRVSANDFSTNTGSDQGSSPAAAAAGRALRRPASAMAGPGSARRTGSRLSVHPAPVGERPAWR